MYEATAGEHSEQTGVGIWGHSLPHQWNYPPHDAFGDRVRFTASLLARSTTKWLVSGGVVPYERRLSPGQS